MQSRESLKCHRGCFNQQRSRTAAGIGEWGASVPASQSDQPCGKVLFQWSHPHGGSVSPAVQAAAAAIQAQARITTMQVNMQAEIGFVQIDRRPLPPQITLAINQGIFHLERREVAVVQPGSSSGHIHPKAHRRMQPAFPVEGLLNSVVQRIATVAAEACHLPQQPEGQPALQVKPVEAGHVGLKCCGTT